MLLVNLSFTVVTPGAACVVTFVAVILDTVVCAVTDSADKKTAKLSFKLNFGAYKLEIFSPDRKSP